MMKKLLLFAILIASISGCETTNTTTEETYIQPEVSEKPDGEINDTPTKKKTSQPKTVDPIPKLAEFPFAKWNGRNIYDFFYDVYEKGESVSSLTNEVFSTSEYKGVSWKITQASRGMNTVGVYIPKELKWHEQDKWKSKIPFPVDDIEFVINRWSEVSYLEGQKFKDHVMFTGYEEGYMNTFLGVTNEIKMLCFLTSDGLDDAINYAESQEE